MAGYMLKVLLEDTHPPVWRRIIVPEKITFADLHEIIGTVFGWDGSHLHDFVTPSRRVTIGSNAEWEETIPVRAARGKNIRSAAGETNEF